MIEKVCLSKPTFDYCYLIVRTNLDATLKTLPYLILKAGFLATNIRGYMAEYSSGKVSSDTPTNTP